jgi:GNAT superfamily N-acetyltransferase
MPHVEDKRAIRRPVPADAHALASVAVRAWRAAYRDLMPDGLLDGLSVEDGTRRWASRIEQSEGAGLLVGTLDEMVVGFAVSGPVRDGESEGVGELYAINLDPDAWGLGLGRILFRGACETWTRWVSKTKCFGWPRRTREHGACTTLRAGARTGAQRSPMAFGRLDG